MTPRTGRAGAAFLAAFLLFSGLADAQTPSRTEPPGERGIEVQAHAFDSFSLLEPARRQFGALTFLGGLELRSRDPAFGGISGAVINADGLGFVAISDHAHWISGRFIETDGRLSGIGAVRIAPMLAPNGRRLKDTRWYDTEGLVRVGRQFFVSVERVHDILRFDAAEPGIAGRASLIPVPSGMKGLNYNQGIEALGLMPRQSSAAGSLVAIAERAPKTATGDDIPGYLIGGKGAGDFTLRRRDDFDVTDLGFLPGGDMLVLERRFKPFLGLSFRIRRIAIALVKPGARLDGETLIEADLSAQIDNMEAMTIHQAADGRTILTLMSDDNFSILQRNLVLRFALAE